MERKWWTLVGVSAATFMLLVAVTVTAVVLPQIQKELGMSFEGLRWVIDAYALALAATLLTAGALADRHGRRRLYIVGAVLFTLGSTLAAVAATPAILIAARVVQGLGGAALYATAMALLASTFHGRDRGVAFGVWGAVTGAGAALGPIIGGILAQTPLGWRGVFWVNVPLGILLVVIAARTFLESTSPHRSPMDWFGFVTLTGGLLGVVYAIIRAGESSWTDPVTVGTMAGGLVLLASFVLIEYRQESPLFDVALLRIPTFAGGTVAAFALNGSLYAMFVYFVLYLQGAPGLSPLEAGLVLLIPSGLGMATSVVAGMFSSRGVPARLLIGGGLVGVAAGLFIMLGEPAGTGWTHLIPGFIVAGLASGFVNPVLAETAVGVVHHEKSGMASGANTTFRQLGIALGTAIYGTILMTENAAAQNLNVLLIVSGAVALLGGVLAFVLIRRRDFMH